VQLTVTSTLTFVTNGGANNPRRNFPLGLFKKRYTLVPLEIAFGSVAAIGAVISGLFGGGLFKQALRHSAENAVLRYQQEQSDKQGKENDAAIHALRQDVALVKRDVVGFQEHVRKLDLLPEILSKLSSMETSFQFLKEQLHRLEAAK
jgi:hypothetical protein